jgi:hypothetical protein
VYDPETHEEASVIDAPCPALEVESRDEAGNAYFSAWTYGPELGMYGDGPAVCVARITPGVYEVEAAGAAREVFDSVGSLYDWVRVR